MQQRKFLCLLPLCALVIGAASCTRDPKVQAQRYVENGNKFFEKAKFKEASIMYRRALQKDLRFGEAYYRLGLTELKLAAFGEAAASLRRAVELQLKNSDAAAKLADIYMVASTQDETNKSRLLMEAHELADRMLQQDPNSFDGHRVSGQLALIENDAQKAASELGAAYKLKQDPALASAYFQALVRDKQAAEAEKLARSVIAKLKDFAPMYDVLYLEYMRQNRTADAGQILKEKVTNNSGQSSYVLQLATHHYIAKEQSDFDAAIQKLTDEKTFPDGHMLAGDFFFFRTRDYEKARQQYEAGARAFPKDKAAYEKRLVELFAIMGKNPEANQLLATILAENPKDTDAIAMRAALMLQTGNREQINQAVNDLQSLVTRTPDNHLLRFNLARAQIAKGDIDLARLQLEEAIKLRPDFVQARELLARIYLAKGDNAKALKAAEETLAVDRTSLSARLVRSSSLLGIGEKDKARDELEVISRIAPDNPDARYQMGFIAWDKKDYKQAAKVFGDLYESNPKDIRGLMGVVETLASQNKMPEATRKIEEALAREPDRRDLKLALANLYDRSEHYDQAIKIFEDMLRADPKSADLLSRLGETQRRKGDVNAAIATFQRASQSAPNNSRALLQLGLLMDGTGRREQARPIYEQVLRIEPDNAIALNNLAFIKAEEGSDLDEALTMAQKARQKMPSSAFIKDTLGWIYIKKNLPDDAIRTLKEIVTEEPGNPSFRFHYGMALMQKGDKASARRELETALRNNPSKDDSVKINQMLAAN
jgi:tetratricopeptide (TPR) repeat protein